MTFSKGLYELQGLQKLNGLQELLGLQGFEGLQKSKYTIFCVFHFDIYCCKLKALIYLAGELTI